jgi:hypothetical protein
MTPAPMAPPITAATMATGSHIRIPRPRPPLSEATEVADGVEGG